MPTGLIDRKYVTVEHMTVITKEGRVRADLDSLSKIKQLHIDQLDSLIDQHYLNIKIATEGSNIGIDNEQLKLIETLLLDALHAAHFESSS